MNSKLTPSWLPVPHTVCSPLREHRGPKERSHLGCGMGFLVAQLVKNLPAMRETWVGSLGWEDPLEKGKATHSSILAWKIPGTV